MLAIFKMQKYNKMDFVKLLSIENLESNSYYKTNHIKMKSNSFY